MRYDDEKFPPWAEYLGLMISFASMIWVPGYAVYYLVTQPGTFMEVSHDTWRDFGDTTQEFNISKPVLNIESLSTLSYFIFPESLANTSYYFFFLIF